MLDLIWLRGLVLLIAATIPALATTAVYNETTASYTGSTQGDDASSSTGMMEATTSGQILATTAALNCSYPGQECLNGNCSTNGICQCNTDFTGERCETRLVCPDNYCFEMGTGNCTVMDSGMYNCSCKEDFHGERCDLFDGCDSSPCHNNATCKSTSMYGDFHCDCVIGDERQNCLLNEEDNCIVEPPNWPNYITCVDLIGSRGLYCSPGHNGSSCRDAVQDTDYCSTHGCLDIEYCNPKCNVDECSVNDTCRNFTAVARQQSTLLYDLTECKMKFADGYTHAECETENGLFDGFDRIRSNLHDCNPFFNTTCTQRFADGICNSECDNSDCLFDGGDCDHSEMNSTRILTGTTIIELYTYREYLRTIKTKLSLFTRSLVHVSIHNLSLGLKIENSNFSSIVTASKFLAAGIGRVPELLNYVTNVYVCDHGMFGNGSDSVCDQQCSSTCDQTGGICHWRTGRCLHGCIPGYWGEQCQNACDTACNGTCRQSDGHCLVCPDGQYGSSCQLTCNDHCNTSYCDVYTGECTCTDGRYWSRTQATCMSCSQGCVNTVCSHGDGFCNCMNGYYGSGCMYMCSKYCKNGGCSSSTGACLDGCMAGFHGNMCDQSCPTNCMECNRVTGICEKDKDGCNPSDTACTGQNQGQGQDKTAEEEEENNTGVIIAIMIALIIVLVIIIIAIICWRRKQSGDYILEDEERETLNNKTTTLEVRNDNLKPVSPYMGRSTDMIELDEKQGAGVYVGPDGGAKPDMVDRKPDGQSMNDSSSSSEDDEPTTGEGAPKGRKRSSLKITLSKEKQPGGEMSPKSPAILVINDKTGEVLSPVTFDKQGPSAFEMPDTPLRLTLAPLASEEDLLSDIGPKSNPETSDDTRTSPVNQPDDITANEEKDKIDAEEKRSRKSSSSSSSKSSKRSSSSSEGKKSDKSRPKSGSSSGSESDIEKLNEILAEYDENKPTTEI